MKRLAAVLSTLPLFGALALTPSKAVAQDLSVTGIPTQLFSLNKSHDASAVYRGVVQVNNNYYFWGGSLCSPYTYESSDISILSDAVNSKKNITIYYKNSNAGVFCLTGLRLNSTNPSANSNSLPKLPSH
ncbi:MAG: hypothetical protein ICV63_04635 [Coleofasciculus sp. Co-bin14]|nr:hypothetical protein [Coleofasciculus sp. Co-bin14]